MKISKKINRTRRAVTRFFTRNIGVSKVSVKRLEAPELIKKILICRPNARLGNLLLITPLIKEVQKTFPNARIDLFVKGGLMPVILQNYEQIGEIIVLPKKPFQSMLRYVNVWITLERKKYDMALNADKESSSGRLAVELSNSVYKFYGDDTDLNEVNPDDYVHIAKYPVYNFRNYLKAIGVKVDNRQPVATTGLKLSAAEIGQGRKILDDLFKNKKKTIAIFTYATGEKCYSIEWWADLYALLKRKYDRDYNILEILPVENVSQINFKAVNFYSKDIREIGAVIANAAVFIGADSGIMHLANAVGTTVLGLFSVSDLNKYQPFGGLSLGVDTNAIVDKDQYLLEIDRMLEG